MSEMHLDQLEEAARAAVVRGGIKGIEELLGRAKAALPASTTPAAARTPRATKTDKPAKVAKAPAAPAKKGAPKGGAREAKRTQAEMQEQAEKAFNVVKANGPINMESIAKATGLSSKTLILPMKALVKTGKVTTKGQKRATTYSIAA